MTINLTAIIKSNSEHTEDIKRILKELVVHSKKETACLQYDLHQSIENPNIFIFHEIWEDEAGVAWHNAQLYIKEFEKNINEKLSEPPIIYKTKQI